MDYNAIVVLGRTFRVWYDRNERVWTLQELDAQGNQIGGCRYATSRDWALVYVGMMVR